MEGGANHPTFACFSNHSLAAAFWECAIYSAAFRIAARCSCLGSSVPLFVDVEAIERLPHELYELGGVCVFPPLRLF
jgi:hypothetical protein